MIMLEKYVLCFISKTKLYLSVIIFLFSISLVNCGNLSEQNLVLSNGNVYQHFIMYGQSLSVGAQSYPVLSRENVPGNYMLGMEIWINYWNTNKTTLNPLIGKLAKQNSAGDTTLYAFSRSGTITAECPLYGAVNHLQKKIGGNFIATSCGTSGRSIEELSKESATKTHYTAEFKSALSNAKTVVQNSGSTISCPVIFWMQGENNYERKGKNISGSGNSTNDKDAYKQLLVTLKNNMQNDIVTTYGQSQKPVFITYQAGCQYTRGREVSIGMAQLEASNENSDIICAGPVYPMPDRGGHLDPNGYRWFGEMLAKVYYKTQILGESFKPLQPKKIMRTNNPNQIKIKYHIPNPPLVLDTWTVTNKYKDYGFEIYKIVGKDTTKQIINNVAIEDDCILITCSADLSNAALEVIYAGLGENTVLTRGHGNVRDSDGYQAYYTYIDLDMKNEKNEYIYYRDPGQSLRAVNQPKDINGQVIYDSPYPLYNWSVAFCYQLNQSQDSYLVPGFTDDETAVSGINEDSILSLYQEGTDVLVKNNNASDTVVDLFDIQGKHLNRFLFKTGVGRFSIMGLVTGIYVVKANVSNNFSKQLKIFR